MIEKELKFGLTAPEYRKLKTLCRGSSKFQANTYFDDKRRSLRRAGAGLRVRVEGKKAYMTLKVSPKGRQPRGQHKRAEYEVSLSLAIARTLLKGGPLFAKRALGPLKELQKVCPGLALGTLRPLGTIHTQRSPLPVGSYKGELDHWKVLGRVFYELEVETPRLAQAEKAVKELFRFHGIAVRPRSSTKLAMLFRLAKKNR